MLFFFYLKNLGLQDCIKSPWTHSRIKNGRVFKTHLCISPTYSIHHALHGLDLCRNLNLKEQSIRLEFNYKIHNKNFFSRYSCQRLATNVVAGTFSQHNSRLSDHNKADLAGVHEEPYCLRVKDHYQVVQHRADSRERCSGLGGE